MEKYRQALVQTVRTQLMNWFGQINHIKNIEVYRFLHSVKGTAGTIGLEEFSNIAARLMEEIDEDEEKSWTIFELQQFLAQLVSLCYEVDLGEIIFDQEASLKDYENAPTILVVDDEISMLMYLKEELENEGWHVLATADPERAITFFYDYNPDCVIIDVYLKDKTGFGMLNIMNHILTHQYVPKIMISVDNSKSVRMKCYQLGADDFIAKPFEIDEFIVRINRLVKRKELIDGLVLVDDLSRVYNRKFFKINFERLFSEFIRKKETFCLALLDLDHFKNINDDYGHLVGDEVIRDFAAFLTNNCRKSDTVYRYGGEEFLMLFPKTTVAEVNVILGHLLKTFAAQTFTSNQKKFSVTFSAGVVEINDPTAKEEDWLQAVDLALYQAKDEGRNRINTWNQQTTKIPNKTIQVAIVDDDPIIRTVLYDILIRISNEDNLKINVLSFQNGFELFEQGWEEMYSDGFIILDGMMPKMDGIEVLKRLRANDKSSKHTILMLTARKSEQDIAQALKLGADDYVTKPINLTILEARIRRLIRKTK